MSSILRALKKLENDPRHLEESRNLENRFVPLAEIDSQRRVSSIFLMVVGGGIVCGLVILAGWWIFLGKGQFPISEISKVSLQDSKLAEISPSPIENLNKHPEKTATEETGNISLPPPETKKVENVRETETAGLPEPTFHIAGEKNILPAEIKAIKETVPAQEIPNLKENEPATPPDGKPSIDSTVPQVVPAKSVAVEVPRLNDPDMKLQAITWSKESQKRITVINSRILREGDIVSGYLIKTINQDDVVLSRDGEQWKIVFH